MELLERSFSNSYRQKLWMDQRPNIKKHRGGMMILVIVFTISATLSTGVQRSVIDVEKED